MAGTLVIDTLTDGSGNTTSATAAIRGSAKAWVNFNGVTTATIRASYNVSSVTRSSTGIYVINFTTPMPNANYCVTLGATSYSTSDPTCDITIYGSQATGAANKTTTQLTVRYGNTANLNIYDSAEMNVAIFG